MYRNTAAFVIAVALLAGCGGSPPPAPAAAPASPVQANTDAFAESGVKTKLEPRTVGPFQVDAIYTGDLALGHFNFYVKGDGLKALRAWVGDESGTGALVTKANWEEDHYCAHIEMPAPVPAGAALWFEIESNDGQSQKAHMPLGQASK